jgi:hypothetical protein
MNLFGNVCGDIKASNIMLDKYMYIFVNILYMAIHFTINIQKVVTCYAFLLHVNLIQWCGRSIYSFEVNNKEDLKEYS